MNLEGKVVIVTGGTRGIGYETVKAFCEHNAKVVLFGSKSETVNKALEDLSSTYEKEKLLARRNEILNKLNDTTLGLGTDETKELENELNTITLKVTKNK